MIKAKQTVKIFGLETTAASYCTNVLMVFNSVSKRTLGRPTGACRAILAGH